MAKRDTSVGVGSRTHVMQVLSFGTWFVQIFVSFKPLSIAECKTTPEEQPIFGTFTENVLK